MSRRRPGRTVRDAVFERDGYRCQYCGDPVDFRTRTVDHFVPVSKGGRSKLSNLVTSCRLCNQAKGDKQASRGAALRGEGK